MKRVVFITSSDADHGFRLAGLPQRAIGPDEAEETLKKETLPETGLIVIDERLMNALQEDELKKILQRWPGVLLVLPSPQQAASSEEDYALRLIRKAIGYHVRVKA